MRGLETVYFSPSIDPRGVTYTSAVQNIHYKKLLKDVYSMFMLDRLYRRRSFEMLGHYDDMGRTADPLRMHEAFRVGGKSISPAQGANLSRLATIYTTIV